MNKSLTLLVMDFSCLIFGIILLVCSGYFASETTKFYYKLLNIKRSEKYYQIFYILGGISFVVFGILSLLGIIKYKN